MNRCSSHTKHNRGNNLADMFADEEVKRATTEDAEAAVYSIGVTSNIEKSSTIP